MSTARCRSGIWRIRSCGSSNVPWHWFFQHREDCSYTSCRDADPSIGRARENCGSVFGIAKSAGGAGTHIPPLAVIEILSPEDRISRYAQRLADYRQMGISNIWVVDPANRVGYDCSTTAWLPVEEFRVAGSAISFRLTDLWSELEANR